MIPKTEDEWLSLPADFPTWKDILEELLTVALEARKQLVKGEQALQLAVRKQLNSFAEFSPDQETPQLKELDNLALNSAAALFRESQDVALQQLAENGVKLSQIAKRTRQVTADLSKSAQVLRLDFVAEAAQKLTESLSYLERLTADVAQFDQEGEVGRVVKRVTASIRKLRESVEGIGEAESAGE